jgi:hypothetical protein
MGTLVFWGEKRIYNKVRKNHMDTLRIIFFVTSVAIISIKLGMHWFGKKKKANESGPEEVANIDDANKKDKEGLQYTLESVNSWLNNCDQKAGMLLAVIGVVVTVIMTGDFVKFIRKTIFTPFVQFCEGQSELAFSWERFTVFFLLVVAVVFLVVSCVYLFRAIGANIDYGEMRKKHLTLVGKSYIFFGSISGMSYDDFKEENVDYNDDLRSQIFVNSQIAMEKFQNYNKGLYWFKFLLLVAALLFVAVMMK